MLSVLQVCATVSSLDGGPAEAALNLNRALRASGIEALIVTTDQHADGKLPEERRRYLADSGIRAILYASHWPLQFKASTQMAFWLWRHVKEADVVHIHGFYLWHALVAAFFAQWHRVPYIIQAHGVFEPYQEQQSSRIKRLFMRFGGRRTLCLASAVAFDTETERSVAALPAAARDIPRVLITPAPRIETARILVRPGERRPAPHILFLARIAPKKRVDLVIKAMPKILEFKPQAQLSIAGDDSLRLAITALDQVPVAAQKAITCSGFVEGDAKARLFNSADLYVLASENENFGISVSEALASGLPVVISKNIALWQEVKEHGAGIVIDELTPAAVADAVIDITRDSAQLVQMGAAARRLGQKIFSVKTTTSQAIDVYRQAVSLEP